MDLPTAIDLIRLSSLREHADALCERVEPCIALTRTPVAQNQLGQGDSRFGGLPDVTDGFEWPKWESAPPVQKPNPFKPGEMMTLGKAGRSPLHFLAQIRLDDLPPTPIKDLLPATGTLYFFKDMKNFSERFGHGVGGYRVIYDNSPADQLTTIPKNRAPKDKFAFPPCSLEMRPGLSAWDHWGQFPGSQIHYAWQNLANQIEGLSETTPRHHLGGGVRVVQTEDVRPVCVDDVASLTAADLKKLSETKLPKLSKNPDDWILLLELGADPVAGFQWGDGYLIFMIHRTDLANQEFSRVWCTIEQE